MEHHGPTSWLVTLPILPEVLRDPKFEHVNGAIVIFLFITICSIMAWLQIRKKTDDYLVPPPKFSLVNIVDMLVEALYKMISGTLGPHGEKHFNFIAAVFIFILFSNFLGLLPLSGAPTANLNTTIALGISSFVYYNAMGIKEQGVVGYLKHFLMGLGPFIGVVVALLEMLSHLVRPVSLGFRLFVNMFIDHMLVLNFQNLFAWLIPVPLLLFGIVVCTIQAFVFATLTAVYVQMATEHEQLDHSHEL